MGFISMTEPCKLVQKAFGRSTLPGIASSNELLLALPLLALRVVLHTRATTHDSAYPDLMPVPCAVASMSAVQNCYKGHFLKNLRRDLSVA